MVTKPEPNAPVVCYPKLSPQDSLSQCQPIGSALTLGPNPNPRLAFQASIHRNWAPKCSRLGNQESHSRIRLLAQEERVLFGAVQCPQSRRFLHMALGHPYLPPWPQFQSMTGLWNIALNSALGETTSAPADWACHALRH